VASRCEAGPTAGPRRRPKAKPEPAPTSATEPSGAGNEWVDHLLNEGRAIDVELDPIEELLQRHRTDDQVVALIAEHVVPEVFDENRVRDFLDLFGPLDPQAVDEALALAIDFGGIDQHLDHFLTDLFRAGGPVNTSTIQLSQQKRLRARFGFTGLPFRKNVTARTMFDSSSQRDLRHGLLLRLELDGLGLVTGPPAVG
jgi:hypothetical protein